MGIAEAPVLNTDLYRNEIQERYTNGMDLVD